MKQASLWSTQPLDVKEPKQVVEHTFRTLQRIAPSLEGARFHLILAATSAPSIIAELARALPGPALGFLILPVSRSLTAAEFLAAIDPKKGMASFSGWLTEFLTPQDAVAIVEKLILTASAGAMRSTSISIDVEGLRLLEAPPEVSARFSLRDMKVFNRKERFALSVELTLPASGPRDPTIANMTSSIARATGLSFDKPKISIHEDPSARAEGGDEQFVGVTFAVHEAFADTSVRVRSEAATWLSLPGLGTSHDALQRRAADLMAGRSEKVSFAPIAKRMIRQALPEYRFAGQEADEVSFEREIDDGLYTSLILVRDRGFGIGKMFYLAVGVRLEALGGIRRTYNLLELVGRVGWRFSYLAAEELERILDGVGKHLPPVMRAFEDCVRRRLVPLPDRIDDDIPTRGAITARQGYDEARAHAATLLETSPLLLAVASSPDLPLRARLNLTCVGTDGRLQRHASWHYRFGAVGTAATVSVRVPSIGSAMPTLHAATSNAPRWRPVGDMWIDSDEAMRHAADATNRIFREQQAQTWDIFLQLNDPNGPRPGRPDVIEIVGPESRSSTPRWCVQYLRADERGRCDVRVLVDAVGLAPRP